MSLYFNVSGANPDAALVIEVTNNVVAPDPHPFGLNQLSGTWGRNSLGGSTAQGFEKGLVRERWFVDSVGTTEDGRSYFDDSHLAGTSAGDGKWDGARAWIYRPVTQADGVKTYQKMDEAMVQKSYVDRGFWSVSFNFNSLSTDVGNFRDVILGGIHEFNNGRVSEWYQHTDLENGTEYYYTVRAVDQGGNYSADSNVVSATPSSTSRAEPRIMHHQAMRVEVGDTSFRANLEITNGEAPFTFQALSGLPAGFELVATNIGKRAGLALKLQSGVTADATHAAMHTVVIRVTDREGASSDNTIILNPEITGLDASDGDAPAPPQNLQAIAMDGAIRLTWDPSPSADVVGYKVFRSKWHPDEQLGRIEFDQSVDIQTNDLVMIEKAFDATTLKGDASLVHDRVLFQAFTNEPLWPVFNLNDGNGSFDTRSGVNMGYPDGFDISYLPHPGTIPPGFVHPGEQCVRLSSPTTWDSYEVRLFTTYSRKENNSFFYRAIEPGYTYHLKVWVYQSGVPGGQVELSVGGHSESATMNKTFTVPEQQWTQLVIDDISATDWDQSTPVEFTRLIVHGGGTVYIDSAEFYRYEDANNDGINDEPAHEMTRFWKNELIDFFQTPDGKQAAFRYWGLQSNGERGVSLDEQLKPVMARKGSGSQDELSLPQFLELCLEVGADPWIIASMSLTEEEYANLFEYLAGDGSTVYGAKRIAHRDGNTTPWIDEFSRLHLEVDNEVWNSMFAWTFYEADIDGDGNQDAAEAYGMFAEMLLRAITSSSLWQSHSAAYDEKVTFVVNGFNNGRDFGYDAGIHAPTAEMVDVAPYLGGWEAGSYIGGDTLTPEGFSKWLVYSPWKHYGQVNGHVELANQSADYRDEPYRLGVYEGGPGYDLPGPNNPSGEVPESYGKSLAAGITTLDSYLFESYRGYGAQAFFGFTPGTRWTTHSMGVGEFSNTMEFRSQATWLAQKLRNNYIRGGMVEIVTKSTPTTDLPAEAGQAAQQDLPLVASYAFKDGNQYFVLLMSRKMPEIGLDDQISDPNVTPVTIQLPLESVQSAMLHKIENDPRRTNVPGLPYFDRNDPLEIESQAIPIADIHVNGEFEVTSRNGGVASTDGLVEGIAGGSIYLYVFEADQVPALPADPVVRIQRSVTQPASTFEQTAEFIVKFDRPVSGFELPDLDFSDSTADLSGATITLEASDDLLPQTLVYTVRVEGVEGGGIVELDIPAAAVTAISDNAPNSAGDGASQQVTLIAGNLILNFNAYDLQEGIRVDTTRSLEGVKDRDTWHPLNTTTPFFTYSGAPLIYGGIRATMDPGDNNGGNDIITTELAANRESAGGWPNATYAGFNTNGAGGKQVTSWNVFLFKKEDFENPDASPLAFNAGTEINIEFKRWQGQNRRVHFVINDGGTYYISEQYYAGEDAYSLNDFVNNPDKRWAVIPFTEGTGDFSTQLDLWESLNYEAKNFSDVHMLGFAATVRDPYNRERSFRKFWVTSVTDDRPYIQYDLSSSGSLVEEGDLVSLSVSAIDADSQMLEYSWEFVSKPIDSTPLFLSGNTTDQVTGEGATNFARLDTAGVYTIRVTASDGNATVQSSELSITVVPPGSVVDYTAWANGIPWAGKDPSIHANPDGDGYVNFLEYAMGLNPLVEDLTALSPYQLVPEGNGYALLLNYRISKTSTSVTADLQTTSDLQTWTTQRIGANGVTESILNGNIDGDGAAELRQLRIPFRSDKLFIRVLYREE